MPDNRRSLISIVVPVYNEEENVVRCYETTKRVLDSVADRYDYEFVFTDNCSTDATFARLEELAARDSRVRAFRFSRNFGFQKSILTGFLLAHGDAAVQLDCDLQDPPALIPEFIDKWEDGYQVVYGVRRSRKEAAWLTGARKLFYRLLDRISDDHIPHDAGDFRLIDRCVIEQLRNMYDYYPYLRGTIASLGFRQIGILYDRDERIAGTSKFPTSQLFRLATDAALNHSIVPLRLATYTGLLTAGVSSLIAVGYVAAKLIGGSTWPSGFATITVLILLSLGLLSLFLGIIGEYLGRLYQQSKQRPITIIQRFAGEHAFAEPVAVRPGASDRMHFSISRTADAQVSGSRRAA